MKKTLYGFALGFLVFTALGAVSLTVKRLPNLEVEGTTSANALVATNTLDVLGPGNSTFGGDVLPGSLTNNLGSPGFPWQHIYASTNSLYLGSHQFGSSNGLPIWDYLDWPGTAPIGTVVNTTSGSVGMPLVLSSTNPTNTVASWSIWVPNRSAGLTNIIAQTNSLLSALLTNTSDLVAIGTGVGNNLVDKGLSAGVLAVGGNREPALHDTVLSNCVDIVAISDGALINSSLEGAIDIVAIGDGALSYTSITNSFDFMFIGDSAGSHTTANNSSLAILGIGDGAVAYANLDNAGDVTGIGDGAFKLSNITNSYDMVAIGNYALNSSTINNSSGVIGLNGGLRGATLTNSLNVSALGTGAGANVNGAYTNLVFLGDQSTIGPTGKDKVIIGSGMQLIIDGNPVLTNITSAQVTSLQTNATLASLGGLAKAGDTATGPMVIQQGTGTGLTITNSASQVGLAVNGFAGQTNDLQQWNSGGTNLVKINNLGAFSTLIGTATTPKIVHPSSSTSGLYFSGTTRLGYTRSGVNQVVIDQNLFRMVSSGVIGWGSGDPDATASDVSLERENTGILQMGSDSATATTQTFKSADGSGTDKNGASFVLAPGKSTGSGIPGDLVWQSGLYTNSSGSTANAYTVRGQIVGRPCALTNATATSFQRFTLATNTQAGIKLFCTVKATDAAFARQSISSDVRVDAVNVNGTITATVSETDNTLAASTGTLTIAYTVVDEGSNVLAIRANANTSLTATPSIKWVIQSINSDGAITVTPVQL